MSIFSYVWIQPNVGWAPKLGLVGRQQKVINLLWDELLQLGDAPVFWKGGWHVKKAKIITPLLMENIQPCKEIVPPRIFWQSRPRDTSLNSREEETVFMLKSVICKLQLKAPKFRFYYIWVTLISVDFKKLQTVMFLQFMDLSHKISHKHKQGSCLNSTELHNEGFSTTTKQYECYFLHFYTFTSI